MAIIKEYYYVVVCTAPVDYTATTQVLTFGPTSTSANVIIPITEEDNVVEVIEQFFARLELTDSTTDVDVVLSPDESIVHIIDNDSTFLTSPSLCRSLCLSLSKKLLALV